MILKKPYAFLIKNFRWIHIILAVLIGYLLSKTYNIYGFFSRYVTSGNVIISDLLPSSYITTFMFIICVLIIAFASLMYLLMKKKNKPKLFYILLSIYYLLLFVGFILYFILFREIEAHAIEPKAAMLYRDLTIIVLLPQIPFLIFSFIRGVGFDIRKFDFNKDLKELDLSDEDSEEFEVNIGVETYKYERFINRRIRELKYYYLENKFVINILGGLTVLIIAVSLLLHFTVYNKTYKYSEKVLANNLGITVNNSYLTSTDYTGKIIEEGKYFLVVNTTFSNNSGYSTVLNLSNYELKTNNGSYYPTISRNNYFIDLGAGYQKEKIESGKTVTYILVYELSTNKSSKYMLRILDEISYKAGTLNSKYKNITLKPKSYDEIETVVTYDMTSTINMYASVLNNSWLSINKYEFKNKFTYKYEACIRSSCSDKTDVVVADASKKKTLLVLEGVLSLDTKSTFMTNLKRNLSFFDAFVQIRYDDKISSITNKTPSSYTEGFVLEVDEKAKSAKEIDLIIIVRDKKYILNLKS